jgi:hypothetical protein
MSKRIQLTRDDLLEAFPEIETAPEILTLKFSKAPFCHLLSTYVIRPVACDQLPFFIHHKNKQPIFMQEKKFHRGGERAKQVDNFSEESDDDEFEQVKTDKKRGQKKPEPVADFNPKFPASDPSKVKVIAAAPAQSAKKPVGKINVAAAPQVEEKIVRPVTGRKETVPVAKPKEEVKPKEVVENPWATM